jgi:hypothetical protein
MNAQSFWNTDTEPSSSRLTLKCKRFTKKAGPVSLVLFLVLGIFSCSSTDVSSKMNFYHGQTIPDQFFRVVRSSAEAIEFEIKVDFGQVHMYHLVLDENGIPLSEGWRLTTKIGTAYTVVMKAKKGKIFERGKKYRLCIGSQNPQEVFVTSNNYQCAADYVFVLPEK